LDESPKDAVARLVDCALRTCSYDIAKEKHVTISDSIKSFLTHDLVNVPEKYRDDVEKVLYETMANFKPKLATLVADKGVKKNI